MEEKQEQLEKLMVEYFYLVKKMVNLDEVRRKAKEDLDVFEELELKTYSSRMNEFKAKEERLRNDISKLKEEVELDKTLERALVNHQRLVKKYQW